MHSTHLTCDLLYCIVWQCVLYSALYSTAMLLGSSAGGAHFSSSTSDEKAVTITTSTTIATAATATSTSSSTSTSSASVSSSGGYVQGMTILCAPFLFVMPEVRYSCASYFFLMLHTSLI
jgi:hypothetical protein